MTFDPAVLTGQKSGRRADRRAARRREDGEGGERDPPAARRHAAVPGGLPRVHHDAERGGAGGRVPRRAHEGARDPRRAQEGAMLPVLYEFPEEMQKDKAAWRDPKNWRWSRRTPAARSRSRAWSRSSRPRGDERGGAARVGVAAPERRDRPRAALGRWAGADFWEQQGREGLTLEQSARALRGRRRRDRRRRPGRPARPDGARPRAQDGDWLSGRTPGRTRSVLERRKSEVAPRFGDFAAAAT
jgi:hypothetical protein